MKLRHWAVLGAASFGILGAGIALKSLLPPRIAIDMSPEEPEAPLDRATLPDIDVVFLRCGYATWPEIVMARGVYSLAPRAIAYSAVLVRHPQATFLYDTGLSSDIYLDLREQSFIFHQTLARFTFEQSLAGHLQQQGLQPRDLDFALISHLHWDHVSGVSDIPGVPLRVNRVEYEAAERAGLFAQHGSLVKRLLGASQLEQFELSGPPYRGFRSSLDLFGDGTIVLVPLPGHTPGHTGMFINRAHGQSLFLLGDAAHIAPNYLKPTTPHFLLWSRITSDPAAAIQTLADLHRFSRLHPELPMIAMHDAHMQDAFMAIEGPLRITRMVQS
jgi:N-acyl homoserine lactone hydrolase